MNVENLYIAKVVKNDDIELGAREAKVQIYIESIMQGWKSDHYPWCRPFTYKFGGSNDFGTLDIPEKDSLVWVFAEKPNNYKNWYYLADVSLKKLNPIRKILTFLTGKFKLSFSAKGLGLSSSYPDIKLTYYKNGVVIGVSNNSDNPEIFVYHPQGTILTIDKEGKMFTRSDEWTHYGDVIIKEGELKVGKEITWNNDTVATKASSHIHGTGVGPSASANPGS